MHAEPNCTDAYIRDQQIALHRHYYYSIARQDPITYFAFVELACRAPNILYPNVALNLLCFYSEGRGEGAAAMLVAGTRDWQVYRAALSAWAAAMRLWASRLKIDVVAAAAAAASASGGGSSSGLGKEDSSSEMWSYQDNLTRIPLSLVEEMQWCKQQIIDCLASGSVVNPVLPLCRQFQLLQLVWVVRGLLLLMEEVAKDTKGLRSWREEDAEPASSSKHKGKAGCNSRSSSSSSIVALVAGLRAGSADESAVEGKGAVTEGAADVMLKGRMAMAGCRIVGKIPAPSLTTAAAAAGAGRVGAYKRGNSTGFRALKAVTLGVLEVSSSSSSKVGKTNV